MESTLQNQALSRPRSVVIVAGVIGILAVLFLVFDAFGKFARPEPVVDAFARQGMPIVLAPRIGAILLALVILYVIPRLRIFGAILLTGYFGGAVAVNMRAGFTPFETVFPIIMGVLIWLPVYLVDERVRALIPISRERS